MSAYVERSAQRSGSGHDGIDREKGDARTRVLMVDKNLLNAEAIVLALLNLTYAARFATPVNAEHLRDLLSWPPEVALLDVDSVGSVTALESIDILREADVHVIVMSSGNDRILVAQCIAAGADGFVDKDSQLNELVEAVDRLVTGGNILDPEERRQLIAISRQEARDRSARLAPFDVLTFREKCVLGYLMEGAGADTIARRSSVSLSTVRSQIKSILQKLGVNSQLAAAGLARNAGWSPEVPRPVGNSGLPRGIEAASA
jgi:two-component system, NarL family, nitrate/nitrite response regulator NarL